MMYFPRGARPFVLHLHARASGVAREKGSRLLSLSPSQAPIMPCRSSVRAALALKTTPSRYMQDAAARRQTVDGCALVAKAQAVAGREGIGTEHSVGVLGFEDEMRQPAAATAATTTTTRVTAAAQALLESFVQRDDGICMLEHRGAERYRTISGTRTSRDVSKMRCPPARPPICSRPLRRATADAKVKREMSWHGSAAERGDCAALPGRAAFGM